MVNENDFVEYSEPDNEDVGMNMEFDIELTPTDNDVHRRDRIARLVKETMRGVHGVGERRRKALGADYEAVTDEVRRIRLQGA